MNIHIRHIDTALITSLCEVSNSMSKKGLFGILYGSISARLGKENFLINRRDALLDNMNIDCFMTLHDKEDYRWKEASLDSYIHASIYRNFIDAQFVICAYAPFISAYSLKRRMLNPNDYIGYKVLGKQCEILDCKDYDTLYERVDTDIVRYFKTHNTNFVVIKGLGIYAYGRDLHSVAKIIDTAENTCKILLFSESIKELYTDESQFEV